MVITIDLYGDTEDGFVIVEDANKESRELKEDEVQPLPIAPALQIVPVELPK